MIFPYRAAAISRTHVSALCALVLIGALGCSGPTTGRQRRDASDISSNGGTGGFGGFGGSAGFGGSGGFGGGAGVGGSAGTFGGFDAGTGGTQGLPDAAVPVDAAVDAAVDQAVTPDMGIAQPDAAVDAPQDVAVDTSPDLMPDQGPDVPPGLVGLVGYWKFDEPSGTSAADSSLSGNNGFLAHGAFFETDHFTSDFVNTGSVSLDGIDDYVVLGTTGLPGPNQIQTISFWVQYTSTSGTRNFLSLTDPSGACGLQIGLRGGRISAWKWGNTELVGRTAPAAGWHNVIYTFDGTNHSLIVDRMPATPSSVSVQNCTVKEAQVGAVRTNAEFFQGNVDDLRIYNRVLTSSEIALIASGGDPAVGPTPDAGVDMGVDTGMDTGVDGPDGPAGDLTTGLVGYWKLDEASGTTVADSSPSGNTGTITGNPTRPTGFPAALFTNPHAFHLDGNDTVAVGVANMPVLDQPRSVSLWFKFDTAPTAGNDTFLSITNRAANGTMGAGFQIGTRGNLLAVWPIGANPVYLDVAAPSVGTWHHVVYTFDGTNHVLYLDGALVESSTLMTPATRPQNHAPAEAIIGNYLNGPEFFTGGLDDIRVWNRVLTVAQVTALFQGQ